VCGGTWSVRSSMVAWAVELSVREFGGSCLREHEESKRMRLSRLAGRSGSRSCVSRVSQVFDKSGISQTPSMSDVFEV
jgi:hypothetical protein